MRIITRIGTDIETHMPMNDWQRERAEGPLEPIHKPFWRYVVAMVLFMAGVVAVGNLIEVVAP